MYRFAGGEELVSSWPVPNTVLKFRMMVLSMNLVGFLFLGLASVTMVGCSKSGHEALNQTRLNKLENAVAQAEAEIFKLTNRLAEVEEIQRTNAKNDGNFSSDAWILWQSDSAINLNSNDDFLYLPAPDKSINGYSSREGCFNALAQIIDDAPVPISEKTPTSYRVMSSSEKYYRVTSYKCLPDSVDPRAKR